MKQLLILILTFVFGQQVYCQTADEINLKNLVGIWGQISEYAPEHSGKSGLTLLTLNKDKSFYAFENTDYGATILQSGDWELKGSKIIFNVTKTELCRNEEKYKMRGQILESDTGVIIYEIVKLDNEQFVISTIENNTEKILTFKQSKFSYFPKSVKINN